jgi:hypothetical protein
LAPGKVAIMSGIPKQVEETADLAEQLHSRMFAEAPSEEVEQEQEEQPSVEENTDESEVPHDDDINELRKFKERYLHLQGKYDAEVPRLHKDLRELKQSVFERLESQIPKQQIQENVVDEFAQEKEAYGEELIDIINRIADKRAEEKLKSSMLPVQKQVEEVQGVQVQAAQKNFVDYLNSKVSGDWHSLWEGKDPKFLEFLNQPDPSGIYTYGELVKTFNDNWDADRLSAVFNTYLGSNQQQSVTRTQRPEKNAMVAPSRQNVHNTPSSENARIWTSNTMKEFQNADRAGRYTPEESKALWDDLLSAPMQNRMR